MELNAVAEGKGLHELEAHAATRQVLVGIGVVGPFGIQDGHGGRQHVVGYVVVADDEVDAFFLGIRNLLYGFDAAVQHDDQPHSCACGIVHSLE